MDTLYQVTGDSYTAGGLTPGQIYRFVISTNCEDGTTSIIKAIIEGVGLITDLTIAGKTPRFPVNEVPCAEIPLNVVWKGFRVSKIGGEGLLSNEFEFVMNSPDWIMFRRVGLHKPIVAQNLVGNWPTCITPAVDIIGDKFRIARLMNGQGEYEVIGIVKYSVSSSHLYVCPIYDDTMFPWKNDYQLTGLTAGNTSPAQGCNGFDDGPSHEKSIALSYSTAESIEVRLRGYEHTGQRGTLWVFNTNGQLVQTLSFEFVSRDEVILANLSPLVPSLYFVAIEIDGQWETHKMCIIR